MSLFINKNPLKGLSDEEMFNKLNSEKGYIEILQYQLNNGVSVHNNNDYCIQYACDKGYYDCVQFLINNKANIHVNDDYCFKVCKKNNNLDILKLLEENA